MIRRKHATIHLSNRSIPSLSPAEIFAFLPVLRRRLLFRMKLDGCDSAYRCARSATALHIISPTSFGVERLLTQFDDHIQSEMQFSLGHVLQALDRTLLNPLLSILIPIGLHVLTENKITLTTSGQHVFPYSVKSLPLLQVRAFQLVAAGVLLRVNRALSRRALNNGVDSKFDWSKEIIVVTGGSGGIGAEAAQKLALHGSKVIVVDVMPLTYPKCMEDPAASHTNANANAQITASNMTYYKCDITKFEEVQTVAEEIRRTVGDPTCVVANAGICRGKPILEASKRDIEL